MDAPFKLTPRQREWWDWAIGGQEAMIDDSGFNADMPDFAGSEHLQRLDLLYRFENQGPDIAEADCDRGSIRVLENLASKLREAWGISKETWLDLADQAPAKEFAP